MGLGLALFCSLLVLLVVFAWAWLAWNNPPAYDVLAVRSLHTIHAAQVQYRAEYGSFARSVKALGPPPGRQRSSAEAANLITPRLAIGLGRGYRFSLKPTPSGYVVTAEPRSWRGRFPHFYSDQTQVIRRNWDQPANGCDPPIR